MAGMADSDSDALPHNDQAEFDDEYMEWLNDGSNRHKFVISHITTRTLATPGSPAAASELVAVAPQSAAFTSESELALELPASVSPVMVPESPIAPESFEL
jgi:hypothetical protein